MAAFGMLGPLLRQGVLSHTRAFYTTSSRPLQAQAAVLTRRATGHLLLRPGRRMLVGGLLGATALAAVGACSGPAQASDSVDAVVDAVKRGVESAGNATKEVLSKVPEGIPGAPPRYRNAGMGFFLGSVLGVAGTAALYAVRRSLSKGLLAMGVIGLIQLAVGLWVSYKGWVTFHWERILDDAELYRKSKLQRFKSAIASHFPLKSGLFVGTLLGLYVGVYRQNFERFFPAPTPQYQQI
ncbi:MAG: hypothetical protein Q8P67_03690 [archaeon]|nr:hypothetical protein [archaeon]